LSKTGTLGFCNVVWRRYLGEVGKFYRTLWLIYPRHWTFLMQWAAGQLPGQNQSQSPYMLRIKYVFAEK